MFKKKVLFTSLASCLLVTGVSMPINDTNALASTIDVENQNQETNNETLTNLSQETINIVDQYVILTENPDGTLEYKINNEQALEKELNDT